MKYFFAHLLSLSLLFGGTFCLAADEIFLNLADPIFAQLDADEKHLLSEYAKRYPKIKEFYENIRIDACVRRIYTEDELQEIKQMFQSQTSDSGIINRSMDKLQIGRHYELRHRIAEQYLRVDTVDYYPGSADAMSEDNVNTTPDHGREIVLFTPAMGYQLTKLSTQQTFFTLNARHNFQKKQQSHFGAAVMYFDSIPFSSNGEALDELVFQHPPLIKDKPYIIEYVRQYEIEGKQVVEIKCTRTDISDSFRIIKLDRNHWGVLESYRLVGIILSPGEEQIRWHRENCTYEGESDLVPHLKTYSRSSGIYDPDTGQETTEERMTCEVTNFVPGPPDLSEFDVAQFLPPGTKIGELTYTQFSIYRIAAIAFGIILVLIGIFMKIRFAIIEARKQQKE